MYGRGVLFVPATRCGALGDIAKIKIQQRCLMGGQLPSNVVSDDPISNNFWRHLKIQIHNRI
jgi:hypothetical protein